MSTRPMAAFLFVSLLLFLGAPPPASATGGGVGFKAGFNVASLSHLGEEVSGDSQLDFSGGAFGWLQFSPSLSLTTEVLYSRRSITLNNTGVTSDYQQNFLEIPAYLSVHFPNTSPVTPRLYGGASASFQTQCELESLDCTQHPDQIFTEDALWALIAGAGVDFAVGGTIRLSIDGRYNYGLSTVFENGDPKYRYVSLYAGIGFVLGS